MNISQREEDCTWVLFVPDIRRLRNRGIGRNCCCVCFIGEMGPLQLLREGYGPSCEIADARAFQGLKEEKEGGGKNNKTWFVVFEALYLAITIRAFSCFCWLNLSLLLS